MFSDYNNDSKLDEIDCTIYNSFILAKIKYGSNPTIAQVQERYNTLYVDTGKSPATTIVSLPDLEYADFNSDSKLSSIDRLIYDAYVLAKALYGDTPTISQVQERYNTIYVNYGKAPTVTIESIPYN